MNESTTPTTNHVTACAQLSAIGAKMKQVDLFGPIKAGVQIKQKTIKHTPIDKLMDALISRFSGAHGLVEINTRLRADPGMPRAFGRAACAEQSVVHQTLSACTSENVGQLHQALDEIYRSHSQGFRHDYQARFQLLDVDLTGMPCGRHPQPLRRRDTLPDSTTVAGDNWAGGFRLTMKKWWSISCLRAILS